MAPNFNSNFLLKNESHQPMEKACLNSIIKQAKIIFCCMTVLFDLVTLILVLRSRKKLIEVEFILLLSLCITIIFIRLELIFDLAFNYFQPGKFLCILKELLECWIAQYYFILFYYSMFHLTIWLRAISFILSVFTAYLQILVKYGAFIQNYDSCILTKNISFNNLLLHRDRKNLVILSKFLNFSILSNLAAISWILNVVHNVKNSDLGVMC
ncbi:hypothetical protein BpHYR1_034744 [Brachionus plicatilis]|uniref:Uncharacterized protein n=1 Tax=Brachionus plicatilis TaxID=10195 RepID=A0A3M7RS88_BRAPC|nr:hypothetical protein BpHYR1_034744 [Brachionus plicatilis]